ncbi:MAG TPA: hypothetical protein VFN67_23570 [Polyangiales bacterium]|nr:hypothetical protein [Polyangiales bacterium]
MNLNILYHVLGTVLCVGVSYGVNHYQRPSFEPSYGAQVYTEEQGSLQLNYHGETLTLPLMVAQAVTYDAKRMGREFKLRELTLRSTAPRDERAKLEIYVDLSHIAGGMSPGAGDPAALAQEELPVARSGRFGTRPSYFLGEDGQMRKVISGNFLLTGVMPSNPHYRAEGRLELQLEGASGVELITGRFEGQLAWDEVSMTR